MKVLFLQDVLPTARAGDIKEVKNGFGRNYLLPNGLAVLATQEELRRAESLRADAQKRREAEASDWLDIVKKIREAEIKIEARTGPTGRLYGSVTNAMIADEIGRLAERPIDRKGIRIPQPIRTIGDHEINVRFYEGVEITIKIEVLPDEESIARNRAAREEEARAATITEERVTDLTFEEVLKAAEAKLDQGIQTQEADDEVADESEESGDTEGDKES